MHSSQKLLSKSIYLTGWKCKQLAASWFLKIMHEILYKWYNQNNTWFLFLIFHYLHDDKSIKFFCLIINYLFYSRLFSLYRMLTTGPAFSIFLVVNQLVFFCFPYTNSVCCLVLASYPVENLEDFTSAFYFVIVEYSS